MIILVNYNSK